MGQCLCGCGKAIAPPRTKYYSDKCCRRARRQQRAVTHARKQHSPQVSSSKKKLQPVPEQEKHLSQKTQPSAPGVPELPARVKKKRTRSKRKHTENVAQLAEQPALSQKKQPSTPVSLVPEVGVKRKRTRSKRKRARNVPLILAANARQPFSLGRNMPAKLTLLEGIATAQQLGYTAIQFFFADPNRWPLPVMAPEDALSLSQALTHFSPVIVHAPLLMNLSSQDETTRLRSIFLLRALLQQARQLGVDAVVVHLTNYKRPASVLQEVLDYLVEAITLSLVDSPPQPTTRLLLENGYRWPGAKIEELGALVHALPSRCQKHVGVCLDTAHCWSAGYDLSSVQAVSCLLETIESTLGLGRINVIHLNDAKYALGEMRDEHAQWGQGQISARGIQGVQCLLQDPRLAAHCALILETPLAKNEQGKPDWVQEQQHMTFVKGTLLAHEGRALLSLPFEKTHVPKARA